MMPWDTLRRSLSLLIFFWFWLGTASFLDQLSSEFRNDDYSRERIAEQGGADASDYSTVFLPWVSYIFIITIVTFRYAIMMNYEIINITVLFLICWNYNHEKCYSSFVLFNDSCHYNCWQSLIIIVIVNIRDRNGPQIKFASWCTRKIWFWTASGTTPAKSITLILVSLVLLPKS